MKLSYGLFEEEKKEINVKKQNEISYGYERIIKFTDLHDVSQTVLCVCVFSSSKDVKNIERKQCKNS
jgi:hypothetical protein